jgi:RNA polymerase sigma-70 factor (ECF subfamily)
MKSNVQLISEQMNYFRAVAHRSLPQRYQHFAEDLAQDAILKAIEKVHYYDASKGNFKSWLYRLTQNHCFDAVRKLNKLDCIPLQTIQIPEHENVDKSIDRSKVRTIRKAMAYLSERDRMLITYRFLFQLSGKEMAQLMNIPEKQVNVYLQRAKERLKVLCTEKAA